MPPTDTSFEQEIKGYFAKHHTSFSDGSSTYKELDFTIIGSDGQPAFHFDAKEKRQTYQLANWPKFVKETH
jgi:hypothetical protein